MYVITQNCCKDASCVPVCPVDCIRPVGAAGEFTDTEMLYIDPDTCIDCGACVEACPVNAIYHDEDLPPELDRYRSINAAYFEQSPLQPMTTPPTLERRAVVAGSLRVAIVGSGPAACYSACELLDIDGVEVDMFERLPTPFGLIRAGVAPDHHHTKTVTDIFEAALSGPRFRCHLNVEVGRDITHEELLAHFHAVIYATGASRSSELRIPGEQLPGSHPASDFVAWYNGHPDHRDDTFDLSSPRAVVIGNGNVALDVARILLLPVEELLKTDIADHAVNALQASAVREVVVVGRRGPRHAAFSVGEFAALAHLAGIDVSVESADLEALDEDSIETRLKLQIAREYAADPSPPTARRIVFKFMASPAEIIGDDAASGIRLQPNTFDADGRLHTESEPEHGEILETGLVLRSVGYRGVAIPHLPYDLDSGTVPNAAGRVTETDGAPVDRVYVAGWIKRGPRGVIGTNRVCARQTVAAVLEDYHSGVLPGQVGPSPGVDQLLKSRGVEQLDWSAWQRIDGAERRRGAESSRPRVKFVRSDEMLSAAGVFGSSV